MNIVETIRYGARGQGALVRFSGSAHWYSRYFVRGKEHVESTGTSDFKKARRFHRQKLDEIATDRQGLKKFVSPVDRRLTVGDLFDALDADYKLRKKDSPSYRSHMKPIKKHFGDWRAVDLSAEAVDVYIEERLEAEMSHGSINRECQLLGQALRLAFERQRIPAPPPIRHLPETSVRQGFFEAEEFSKLVAALPDYLQDLTRFAYLTGWRRGEVISLRWSDVDRPGAVIRLRPEESKNGQGRTVPIDGDLAPLIERRWQGRLVEGEGDIPRVTDLVFHNAGEPIVDFRKAWATACVKAGLYYVVKDETGKEKQVPEKLFHDLRRTAVRDMIRAGVPERVAMDITGHKTRSVFDRYNIVNERDKREALQRRHVYSRA